MDTGVSIILVRRDSEYCFRTSTASCGLPRPTAFQLGSGRRRRDWPHPQRNSRSPYHPRCPVFAAGKRPDRADGALDSRHYRKFSGGGRIATHIRLCDRSLNGTTPRTAPAHPAPVAGAVTFDATTAGKNHMKLTTIALASVLTITSSMAFAQGADGAGGGGTSGAAGSSSVGSSTGTETTGISSATTGSSLGLNGGFSTGTYPTLVTPGGLPSSVPAPGAVISR